MNRKILMQALLVFVATVFALPSTALPPAQLGIAPHNLKLSYEGKNIDRSVTLYNYGERAKKFDLAIQDVENFTSNAKKTPSEQGISQWTVLAPRQFVIPAGGSQVVRLSIRPQVRLEKGRLSAYLRLVQTYADDTATEGKLLVGTDYSLPIALDIN